MTESVFTKPVLVIAFRRPDFTRQLLEVLKRVRPPRLYLALDAPRDDHPEDVEAYAQVRLILEGSPWGCEVFRNYAQRNGGSGGRVPSAVCWMLGHEEDGIILEDDCLPDDTFFPYCEELLDRYREDERVVGFSGQLGRTKEAPDISSYFFSKYHRTWCWATWRRAWQHYDHKLTGWDGFQRSPAFERKCFGPVEISFWRTTIQMLLDRVVNAWDFRWLMSFWMRDGLIAVARKNLGTNNGFRWDSTHTAIEGHGHLRCESSGLSFPLIHPAQVAQDAGQDLSFWRENLQPFTVPQRARRKLRVIARRTANVLRSAGRRIAAKTRGSFRNLHSFN